MKEDAKTMSSMKVIQAAITMLSLINPVVCALMLSQIESGESRASRVASATKAVIAIFVVLVVAALVGARLLGAFGISLDVFQVAGGLVLVWMGFAMIRKAASPQAVADASITHPSNSLTPLILFGASPGTITGVITLSVNHTGMALPVTALLGIAIASLVLWLVLLLSSKMSGRGSGGGDSFMHDLLSGMMGLIVVAMGFQFGMTGAKAFFVGS